MHPDREFPHYVVEDPVLIALGSEQLDTPSSHISDGIRWSSLRAHCRYSDQCRRSCPYFWEKSGTGDIRNIVGAFEVAKSASSLSMNNPGSKSWERATENKGGNLEQTFLVYVHGQSVQGSRWVEYLEEEVNHRHLVCWCCMRLQGFVEGTLCCYKQMGLRYSKNNFTFSKSISWGSNAVQLVKISISSRLEGAFYLWIHVNSVTNLRYWT